MNPFDIGGPDFLRLYALLLAVLVLVAGIVRHSLRTPADDPGRLQLDPYQTAFLAGGYQAAAEAAIVSLTARGVLNLDPSPRLQAVAAQPMLLHPVEQAIFAAAAAGSPGSPIGWLADRLQPKAERKAATQAMTPAQKESLRRVDRLLRGAGQPVPGASVETLEAAARPALAEVERELRGMGLVMGPGQIANVRAVPSMIVLAAGVLGGVRLARGMILGRPVGYLIGLLIVSVILALFFVWRPNPRTRRGHHALRRLRQTNAALRASAVAAAATLAGTDLALAVGLWGPGVLAGSPLDSLGAALRPSSTTGYGGWGAGSSSCGSSGGSSCGGGCGGGGGGGCGG